MTFVPTRTPPLHYAEVAPYLAPRLSAWLHGECCLGAAAGRLDLSSRYFLARDGTPARAGWWNEDEIPQRSRAELADGLMLVARLLYAWEPFDALLQRAASVVGAWRCALEPGESLGARVGLQGIFAALTLAIEPLDVGLDAALAEALERSTLMPAEQLLVYPALERLIEQAPDRLKAASVAKLVIKSPLLCALPSEAWRVLVAHGVVPQLDGQSLERLLGAPSLVQHILSELCHSETEADERERLESILHMLRECAASTSPARVRAQALWTQTRERSLRFGILIDGG